MDSYLCHFSRLPGSMCEVFLQRAFCQLDQRYLYGIAPLVCHAWRQTALSVTGDTLELQFSSPAKAKQLKPWMQRHGKPLTSISITSDKRRPYAEASSIYAYTSDQLRALSLEGSWLVGDKASALTSLTSLSLSGAKVRSNAWKALLALKQLRTLDLSATCLVVSAGSTPEFSFGDSGFLAKVSTTLSQLTRLNVTGAFWVKHDNFAALRALPQLQEVEAGQLIIAASRLRPEFTGLPITSLAVSARSEEEVAALKAWLQQGAHNGIQLSPLSCLRSLDLGWVKSPTTSLGMESWASKLVQLTELVLDSAPEEDVCKAFGLRFLYQKPDSGAFFLRPGTRGA